MKTCLFVVENVENVEKEEEGLGLFNFCCWKW